MAAGTGPDVMITLAGLGKSFTPRTGEPVIALENVTAQIHRGEFISLVGPSGCGKSTLLRLVAGLIPVTAGEARLRGRPITAPSAQVGMAFQKAVLFAWKTVLQNVMLSGEILKLPRQQCLERAHELLDMMGLRDFKNKYPGELSGGMQQRVAIAPALVHDPEVRLMDEPIGARGARRRGQMNLELQSIWQSRQKTVLFVTHSISEAVFLSDRVMVFTPRPGRVAGTVSVDLPRPRQLRVMNTPEFGRCAEACRELLGSASPGRSVDH